MPHSQSAIVARLRAAGCVFAEDEAELLITAARTPAELTAMVERRIVGVPLEQILGWAEFCDLQITVEPGVFVPRRRTELLVRQAQVLAGERAGVVVVELCCGSGAVGAALLARLDRVEVYAADIDPAAVRCARRNIAEEGRVFEGDLYDPLPATLRGRVGILVANAPYVPTESIATSARHHTRLTPSPAADCAPGWLDPRSSTALSSLEPCWTNHLAPSALDDLHRVVGLLHLFVPVA